MKRNFVKAGAFKLKRSAKPGQGNHIITEMTGNPNFPSTETTVMLGEVQTISDELDAANEAAKSGDHELIAFAVEKELEWNLKYMVVARYVQDKADADIENSKSLILSSGFGVRKTPETWPEPEMVTKLIGKATNTDGEILVKWRAGKHSKFFRVYHTTTPDVPGSWTLVDTTSSRKSLQTGLGLAVHYYKVVALNNTGRSMPSPAVSCVCLPA